MLNYFSYDCMGRCVVNSSVCNVCPRIAQNCKLVVSCIDTNLVLQNAKICASCNICVCMICRPSELVFLPDRPITNDLFVLNVTFNCNQTNQAESRFAVM